MMMRALHFLKFSSTQRW